MGSCLRLKIKHSMHLSQVHQSISLYLGSFLDHNQNHLLILITLLLILSTHLILMLMNLLASLWQKKQNILMITRAHHRSPLMLLASCHRMAGLNLMSCFSCHVKGRIMWGNQRPLRFKSQVCFTRILSMLSLLGSKMQKYFWCSILCYTKEYQVLGEGNPLSVSMARYIAQMHSLMHGNLYRTNVTLLKMALNEWWLLLCSGLILCAWQTLGVLLYGSYISHLETSPSTFEQSLWHSQIITLHICLA